MIDQFSDWVKSKQTEIDHVGKLLFESLPTEPSEMIEALTGIEAWNGRISELLAHCSAFLDRAKLYYLPSDSLDMKESERKATVDSQCADIRKMRDILQGYSDAIKQRLILGESLLRWEKPHQSPAVMESYPGRSAADILRGKQ